MQCPYFTLFNYGAYDSSVTNIRRAEQKDRLITAYEFEFYTEDCSGGICINSKRYTAKKGYFTCTKPGQIQKMMLPYKCYFFNICTQDEALCELFDHLPEYSFLWCMDEVVAIFREMLAVESTGLLANRLQLEGCVCKLISLVARSRPYVPEKGEDNTLLHRKNLQLADKYIREHFAEELSLENLAARYNLHPNYFHRLYTAAYGKTPAQRILSCRISAAKTALLTENRSISEVAAECGFSSQSYFGYKFKEVTGYSPLQFRKKMLSRKKNEIKPPRADE